MGKLKKKKMVCCGCVRFFEIGLLIGWGFDEPRMIFFSTLFDLVIDRCHFHWKDWRKLPSRLWH
jgi:hypothetical protein